MKAFLRTLFKWIGVLAFWILLWFGIAKLIGIELLLPSPAQVLLTLKDFALTAGFWKDLAVSFLRVLGGIALSLIAGSLLAVATSASSLLHTLLSPAMSAIKSVPVASFITLVFLWMDTALLPIFITSLIVVPIVWSNVSEGIRATDPKLKEVAKLFRFSFPKKLWRLYIPSVFPYFLAACRSGFGMAWKAGIAAEVLAPPLFGIGRGIYYAKTYYESAELFAWTFAIILLSILIEKALVRGIQYVAKRLHLTVGGVTDAHS